MYREKLSSENTRKYVADKTQEKDELYESENLAATSIGCSNPNDSTEAVE